MKLRHIFLLLLTVQAEILAAHFGFMHGVAPMAIVLIEGFDHLTAAELPSKGWTTTGATSSMVAGRFDGQAMRLIKSGGATTNVTKTLPASYSTIIWGFAFQTPLNGANFAILQAGATTVAQISLSGTGMVVVKNGSSTTIATGTTALTAGTWNYIEIKIVVAGAAGSVEVRLNGAVEIASTTGNFGSTNVDTLNIPSASSSDPKLIDDMYVADTTGAAPRNTFLGDVRVETIYPTSDGAHSQWTPNAGTTHYTQVDEAQADGDTTYVSDATPGDIDTYGFGDVDGAATVYAVQTNLYARKDDANTRQIAPVIRQGGTDHVGATVTLSSSYVTYSEIHNQDPAGSDWTATNVNADEYGVKEIA